MFLRCILHKDDMVSDLVEIPD